MFDDQETNSFLRSSFCRVLAAGFGSLNPAARMWKITDFSRSAREQTPRLPIQLQRELYLTGRPLEKCRLACGCDRPGSCVPDRRIGVIELGRVEHFGAELKAAIFSRREREILKEGRIDLLCSGPNKNIASGISKYVLSG